MSYYEYFDSNSLCQIIQKLSTRPAILENRMKLLKQIADENGITLQPEVTPSTAEEVSL